MSDLYGVDVASWQGTPGQWQGAAGRISWGAVKITELQPDGTRYVDPDAAADLAYLERKRLGRIFYLYARPGTDPAATVAFFVTEARRLGIADHDAVMLDLEETDGKTPAEVSAWARAVLSGLDRELDRLPLLYSYPYFIESGNCAGCEKYPLWISDPNHPAGHPVVPRPWKLWAIHQYDTSAPIDRDLAAYTSLREMQAALGKRGAVPVHRGARPEPSRPKRHVVKKTVRKAHKVVKQEPVMTAVSANSAIAAAVVWWAHHLGLHWTVTQQHAILTIVTALAGMAAAAATRPWRVTAFVAALSTAATAAAAFGLHLDLRWMATEILFGSGLLGLVLRGHVSPAVLADAENVAAAVGAPATPAATAVPAPVPPVT